MDAFFADVFFIEKKSQEVNKKINIIAINERCIGVIQLTM
jgi:hypothetical protein